MKYNVILTSKEDESENTDTFDTLEEAKDGFEITAIEYSIHEYKNVFDCKLPWIVSNQFGDTIELKENVPHLKFKLTSFKVLNGDGEYLYSTKFEKKLFDWCEEILIYDRPTSIEDAIEKVENSKMYLITN